MKSFSLAATLLATLFLANVSQAQFYGKYQDLPNVAEGRVSAVNTNAEIRVDQKLNTIIPPDLSFTNQDGKTLTTKEMFADKPTLLLMVFYQCSGVCTTELNSLVDTVKGIKKEDVGDLYNIVVVSIDPTETPELAAQKKEAYTNIYDRRGTDRGWQFYVGKDDQIKKLAAAVGFHYSRDESNGNIVHPAALMVVSPHRRLTRYFLAQQYDSKPVLEAVKDAQEDKVGDRDTFATFISCVQVDPLTGQRSLNVMKLLRFAGVGTLLILGTSILIMNKNKKSKSGGEA